MKRYLYLNALEITEDDILDKEAGNIKQEQRETKHNPKMILFNKFKAKQLTSEEMNAFCQHYGIDGSNESSIQEFLRKGDINNFIDEFKRLEVINAG